MIGNSAFARKIAYGLAMAALLIPLYMISRPAMRGQDGQITEGGVLAQLRSRYDRSGQRIHEARHARPARRSRQPALGTRQ
jgi:hypothetical protein